MNATVERILNLIDECLAWQELNKLDFAEECLWEIELETQD